MNTQDRKVLFVHDGPLYVDENGNHYGVHFDERIKKRYLQLGDHVTFLMRKASLASTESNRFSYIKPDNFSFIEVPNFKSISGWIKYGRSTKRIIDKAVCNHDIVVGRLPTASGRLAILSAQRHNKPHMVEFVGCTFDAYWNYNWKGKLIAHYKLYQNKRLLSHLPYVIYVTNNFLQNRYPTSGKNIACSNVEITSMSQNDIDDRLDKLSTCNPKEIVLATVAALNVPYKGQDDVIRAIARLNKQKGWKISYKLIGQGDASRLRKLSQQLNVGKDVEIIGSVEHSKVFDILKSIDLYIQPSKVEGLPRALIEAMSVGCPSLGARTAGIPELLEDSCTFSPGNISQIIKIIISIDKNWLKEQAKRNFETAKNYQKDILEKRRKKFYDEFLSDHGFK